MENVKSYVPGTRLGCIRVMRIVLSSPSIIEKVLLLDTPPMGAIPSAKIVRLMRQFSIDLFAWMWNNMLMGSLKKKYSSVQRIQWPLSGPPQK